MRNIQGSHTIMVMDRDKMCTFQRGSSIDASYQVWVHLAKPFQRRRLLKINQSEIIACGQGWQKSGKYSYFPGRREIPVFSGKYWEIRLNLNYRCFLPSLDHLATRFQRRLKKKLNQKQQELPLAAMLVNGSGRNEQSLQRTFHRCFLPSFKSFG